MLSPLPRSRIHIDLTGNRLTRTAVDHLDHQNMGVEADGEHDRRPSMADRVGDELVGQKGRGIHELRRARTDDAAYDIATEPYRLGAIGEGTLHFVHFTSPYPNVLICTDFHLADFGIVDDRSAHPALRPLGSDGVGGTNPR